MSVSAQTQGKPPLKKKIFCEKFLDGIFTRCIVSGGVRRHKGCNKAWWIVPAGRRFIELSEHKCPVVVDDDDGDDDGGAGGDNGDERQWFLI